MESSLWSALQETGYQATSCCRSPAYNQQLRSCGYNPSSRSPHMFGQAVDIIASPASCKTTVVANFKKQGVSVCPFYHDAHCHVALCGNLASRKNRMADAGRRASGIRAQNRGRGPSSYRSGKSYSSKYSSSKYASKKKRGKKRSAASTDWNWQLNPGGAWGGAD